jgi:uncharacterized protein YndB with AHSA1/START domain
MESSINTIQIDFDVTINAPISNVWDCLIKDISLWWRKDFYTSEKTKSFVLEPFVGGRMYEDYGNQNGLLWATVLVLDAPNTLELKGHLTPQWGGPAISFMKISLSKNEDFTILRLSETTMGKVSENSKKQLEDGWKMIYQDALKKYVEQNHLISD